MSQTPPTVETRLTYIGPMDQRPRYYARDSSRDVIVRDRRTVRIEDARFREQPPTLAREGFALFRHTCAVTDFRDPQQLTRLYLPQIRQLILEISGADHVTISGPVILRLSDRSPDPRQFNILRPARFVHIDISDSTAAELTERSRPRAERRSVRRCAHYNIWRALSSPPQDVPLAVCDARSVCHSDLVDADAIMDIPGEPESARVVVMVRYNPRHRWSYFSNMDRDEVLIFKSHDSDPGQPHHVPHSAFKDSSCPRGAVPRASIETRAAAFWLDR